jgi:hypothetical protein
MVQALAALFNRPLVSPTNIQPSAKRQACAKSAWLACADGGSPQRKLNLCLTTRDHCPATFTSLTSSFGIERLIMGNKTVKLSDKGGYREIAVDDLPRNVRAAVTDLSAKNPVSDILVDQAGMLYRIHLTAPANIYLDVLAVA